MSDRIRRLGVAALAAATLVLGLPVAPPAAADDPLPVEPIAAEAGRAPYPYRVVTGAALTQLLGGAAPFTDAEGEESPAPPNGLLHFG